MDDLCSCRVRIFDVSPYYRTQVLCTYYIKLFVKSDVPSRRAFGIGANDVAK